MDLPQLQKQYVEFVFSAHREGQLDENFTQIQKLADEKDPAFVLEIIAIYFSDSDTILHNLTTVINESPELDFDKVTELVQTLMGSSSSIGVKKVRNVCSTFKAYCKEKNRQGCLMCLHQLQQEYATAKGKLETIFSMQQQILGLGGKVPIVD